jgi:hypothetical protein
MIPVLSLARPIARRFRILRSVTDYRGTALVPVPFQSADSLILHAATAELALERARQLLPAWVHRGLVAVSEES